MSLRNRRRAKPAPPPGKVLKVLIVDDEPAVCRFIESLLSAEGYATEVAVSAPVALTIARTFGPFDLLLTDADDLPPVRGADLASEVRRLVPEIKVLYLARPDDVRFTDSGGSFAREARVDKPVSPPRLLHAISELLSGRRGEIR